MTQNNFSQAKSDRPAFGASAASALRDTELLQRSSLYREFMAEREEVLKHKWIESEKAGYDIGFEHALVDWVVNHRANWRRSRRSRAGMACAFN